MSMKAKILELLREKKDRVAAGAPESEAYVSGQELCEQFGVSRTAVWKAIGQLKKKAMSLKRYRTAATVCWIRRRKSTTRRISRAD